MCSDSSLLLQFKMLSMQNTEASKFHMESISIWLCQHLASLLLECVLSIPGPTELHMVQLSHPSSPFFWMTQDVLVDLSFPLLL